MLNSIVFVHLANSRLGAEESLYSWNDKLEMESNDTISSYYQKLQSAISAKNEAFLKCSPVVELPDESSQQSIKIINCLTEKYVHFFRNDLIEYPLTLEDAYTQFIGAGAV